MATVVDRERVERRRLAQTGNRIGEPMRQFAARARRLPAGRPGPVRGSPRRPVAMDQRFEAAPHAVVFAKPRNDHGTALTPVLSRRTTWAARSPPSTSIDCAEQLLDAEPQHLLCCSRSPAAPPAAQRREPAARREAGSSQAAGSARGRSSTGRLRRTRAGLMCPAGSRVVESMEAGRAYFRFM